MLRNVVLVGSSLRQGSSQAVTAGLILTDSASVGSLILLAGVYDAGNGLVIPAEVGLVPQSVSDARLQQANALQGLSRNFVGVLGPALGGVFVVAGSPGIALALDSVTFFVAAALFAAFRIPGRVQREREGEGSSTSCARAGRSSRAIPGCGPPSFSFGVSNFVFVGWWAVLGPVVAKEELGGAGAWATVLPAWGIGAVVGGLAALRYRPKRPLLASVIVSWPILLQLLGLALYAPVWLLAAASFLSGAGIAMHLALWFMVFHREVPAHALRSPSSASSRRRSCRRCAPSGPPTRSWFSAT